jgi:hypothetical protein
MKRRREACQMQDHPTPPNPNPMPITVNAALELQCIPPANNKRDGTLLFPSPETYLFHIASQNSPARHLRIKKRN